MGTSTVGICNLALSRIGVPPIGAITENSVAARLCNRFYEYTRDATLVAANWNFASDFIELAEVTSSVNLPDKWQYAFQKPVGCLKLQSLQDPESEFRVVGDKVFTNVNPCLAYVTNLIEDPAKFAPMFVQAMSCLLAAEISQPVTGKTEYRSAMERLFKYFLDMAVFVDATEWNESIGDSNPYVEAR
jgi:hypothetical protein